MRAVALAAAGLALAGVGLVSALSARDQLAVVEACDAAARGEIERALALTENLVGPDPTGRHAAVCRCEALAARGETEACAELLDPLVADGSAWVPDPALAELLIRTRRDAGHTDGAAALARAAGAAHPEDAGLFLLELELRAAREPEGELLRELASRVPARGEAAARMRVALAQRQLMRGDPPAALRALGPAPLPEAGDSAALWFDTLGIAHAMNDDLAGARRAYARWQRSGGDPREVRARYAVALSVSGLGDPALAPVAALRRALDDALALGDERLAETAATRLLYTLVASGESEAALALYDEVTRRLPLPGVSRGELERARLARELELHGPGPAAAGALVFELAPDAPAGTLWLSPPPGAEPDAPYRAHPIAPGERVRVERRLAAAPQRWVLRAGDALGSGTVYPRRGEEQRVEVGAGGPPPRPGVSIARAPADGRRRVLLLLLDCGDWPLVQYLRARGDLPVLDALLSRGYRAVLDSDPPLTAAALEALVWPERRSDVSVLGIFYRFGVELAGLESVGSNPVEWLSWLLPESDDLFGTVGGEGLRAANLLLAHGGVRAGRHGVVHGPHGRRESLEVGRSRRPLSRSERQRFPALDALDDSVDTHYVETLAAEFDATEALLAADEVDLMAVRIEPLDILTHAHFDGAVREGADHGRGLLFETYRYLDARIGGLHPHLDGDDVLIVFSDHGIRTAMQHSRPALFVAAGRGIPHGRAEGRPAFRGVARVAAELLGVETSWPDTGIAPWTARLAEAPR